MSDFGYGDAPPTRPSHSAPMRAGCVATDDSYYAPSKVIRCPRYTFDPATLLDQSIEAQLHRLYRGPEFDAGPAPRSQDEPPRNRNATSVRTTLSASRSMARSSSANLRPYDTYEGSSRSRKAQPRPPNSSVWPRGILPRPDGTWSRPQRKEELIETGLEPLQNVVGLDGYFLRRCHPSRRPLAVGGASAGRATGMSENNKRSAHGGPYRGGARAATSAFPHSSFSSLPLVHGRQKTFPVADVLGLDSRNKPVLTPATAHAGLRGVPSLPYLPNDTEEVAPQSSPLKVEDGEGDQDKETRPSSALSSSRSSGASESSNESEDDVFFDEDPLSSRVTQIDTASLPNPPKLSQPTQSATFFNIRAVSADAQKDSCPLSRILRGRLLPQPSRDGGPTCAIGVTSNGPAEFTTAPKTQERLPPSPSQAASTVARDAEDLAVVPHRQSIVALLEYLLRLRLQQQRVSHSPAGQSSSPAATLTSISVRKTPTHRGRRRGGQGQLLSKSQGRQSASPQRRPHQPPWSPQQHSFSSATEERSNLNESSEDNGVYVRLYRRYRRCECCEVPLPREVIIPQPPPRSCKTVQDGRPRRDRHRLLETSKPASSSSPRSSFVASFSVPDVLLSGMHTAPPQPSSSRTRHADVESYEKEEGAYAQGEPRYPFLSVSLERALLQRVSGQDEKGDAASADHTMGMLRAPMKNLQRTAEPKEDGLTGPGACPNDNNEEALRDAWPREAATDDNIQAELLCLTSNKSRVPPAVPASMQQLQHLYCPSCIPYAGAALPQPNPYAANAQLYPYNVPHPPQRNESSDTVSGGSRKLQEAAAPIEVTGEENRALEETLPTTHYREQMDAQQPALRPVGTNAEDKGGGAFPPLPHSCPMEDKSVQTSFPNLQCDPVIEKMEKKQHETPVVVPVSTVSAIDSCHPEVEPRKKTCEFVSPWSTAVNRGATEECGETVSILAGSLPPFATLGLVPRTPSLPPTSTEETNTNVPAPTSADITATEAEKTEDQQPPTGTGMQTPVHQTVVDVQLQLLMDVESSLRMRLGTDEADARRDICLDQLSRAEIADRWRLKTAEMRERLPLHRGVRYARDRLLVMEVALKEWSRALEEEEDAWTQLMENAMAEAAAAKQYGEAKVRLHEQINELLYEEAQARRSIGFVEFFVRHELQISLCDYEERYTREDTDFEELATWLGMQHNFVMSTPRVAKTSPSSMPAGMRDVDKGPTSIELNADRNNADFATAVEQFNTRDKLSVDGTRTPPTESENCSRHSGVDETSDVRPPTSAGGDSEEARPPLCTQALLLSNEERDHATSSFPTTDTQMPADMPKMKEGSDSSAEKDSAGFDNEPPSSIAPATATTPTVAAVTIVPNSSTTMSVMSDALVFDTFSRKPTPETFVENHAALSPLPPPSPHAVDDDGFIPNGRSVVGTVKENVLSSIAAPMTDASIPATLPVAAMTFESLDTSKQVSPAKPPLDKENSLKEESAVQVAAIGEGAMGVTANSSSEIRLSNDSPQTSTGNTREHGNAELESSDVAGHSDKAADEEVRQGVRPTTFGRRSPAPPLEHPALCSSSSSSSSFSMTEDMTPEAKQQRDEDNRMAAEAQQANESLEKTGSDRESGSSQLPSLNPRKRRQRQRTRHRIALAHAIEMEEAEEEHGWENGEESSLDSETPGDVPAVPATQAVTAATQREGNLPPRLWCQTAESSELRQNSVVGSSVHCDEMRQQATKVCCQDAQEEEQVENKEWTPLENSDFGSQRPAQDEKVRLEMQKNTDGGGQENAGTNNNITLIIDSLARADGNPLAPLSAEAVNDEKKDTTSLVPLPAATVNYEGLTDNRRFLSPLTTHSEVNLPRVNSEDNSSCSTPASTLPSAQGRRENADIAARIYQQNHTGVGKEQVQLPAAFVRSLQETVPLFCTPSDGSGPVMASFSESSLSSPHLPDRQDDDGGVKSERSEGEEDNEEEYKEAEPDVEDCSDKNEDSASGHAEGGASQTSGSVEGSNSRRRSSFSGKDEVTLMHERMQAMKAAGQDPATEPYRRGNGIKVGHGFTKKSDKLRLFLDSELLEARDRTAPCEMNGPHLDRVAYADSPTGSKAPAQGQNQSTNIPNGEEGHRIVAERSTEKLHRDHLGQGEFTPRALSHSSLDESRRTASVAMSKTQCTCFGSLDSDALTPLTRRMRAKCWEENGTASPTYGPDATPRPPTPEFVRNMLAEQLKRSRHADGALTAAHELLPHVRDGDREAEAHEALIGEAEKNSRTTDGKEPFNACVMRNKGDFCEEPRKLCGAHYVVAEGGDDLPQLTFMAPAESKAGFSVMHGKDDGNTGRNNTSASVAVDATNSAPSSFSSAPQPRPPFPGEAVADTHNSHLAEANKLIPLKHLSDDALNSGAPSRFAQLRVRIPSPHPKALRRNHDETLEESTTVSADDESSPCVTPFRNDTRLITTPLSGSLHSEDLANAQIQKGVQVQLVDSFSANVSVNARSLWPPE